MRDRPTGPRATLHRDMKAMILAAGLGTRLFPLTCSRPKPAIPYLNRPLLCHVVDWLQRNQISDLIINLHHLPDTIRQWADRCAAGYGARLAYSYETEILGTGGGIEKVRSLLAGEDPFVVVNGKIYTDVELHPVLHMLDERNALAVLVVIPNDGTGQFNPVLVNAEGEVMGFSRHKGDVGFIFTGIQVVSPRFFRYLPPGRFSDTVADVYPAAISSGEKICAYVSQATWLEFSTLARYQSLTRAAFERRLRAFQYCENLVEADASISPSAALYHCVVGSGCRIDPGCRLQDSVLWDDVAVGEGSHLQDVIIADKVSIPAWSAFKSVAIVADPGPRSRGAATLQDGNLVFPISP